MMASARGRRATADIISGVVAAAVLGLCVYGIAVSGGFNVGPSSTSTESTTTETVTTPRVDETTATTYQQGLAPTASPAPQDSTVTKTSPDQTRTTVTTKTLEPDNSLVERAFQSPFVFVMFELLLALLTAFLAAAATQRIILGVYGLKVGNLELDAIPPITTDEAQAADTIQESDIESRIASEIPEWAQIPPNIVGNPRLVIAERRAVLEDAIRRSALNSEIYSDDLMYILRRLYALDAIPIAVMQSSRDLLRLGDRVLAGAKMSRKVETLLLASFERAITALLPIATTVETASDESTTDEATTDAATLEAPAPGEVAAESAATGNVENL